MQEMLAAVQVDCRKAQLVSDKTWLVGFACTQLHMHTLTSKAAHLWGQRHHHINVGAHKRQQALLQGRSGGGRGRGDAEAARLQGSWQGVLGIGERPIRPQ